MLKRKRDGFDGELRPYGSFGYGHAFSTGSMTAVRFGDHPPPTAYSMAELRVAWAAYKDRFLSLGGDESSWAWRVFENGENPDAVRDELTR